MPELIDDVLGHGYGTCRRLRRRPLDEATSALHSHRAAHDGAEPPKVTRQRRLDTCVRTRVARLAQLGQHDECLS